MLKKVVHKKIGLLFSRTKKVDKNKKSVGILVISQKLAIEDNGFENFGRK